jgi:F-type H+-transporting ATPase subunit gamma
VATLRDIKRRIKSVRNTQQITKAMEMVAAAKLRRAQGRAVAARPYARGMEEMLSNLAATLAAMQHPLTEARPVQKRALLVFASNRGLAGSYNAQIIRFTEQVLRGQDGPQVQLVLIGKKLNDYFRRRSYPVLTIYGDLPDQAQLEVAQRITRQAIDWFRNGEVDAVDLVYSQFVSATTRNTVRVPFLPIGQATTTASTAPAVARDYIFEPNAQELVDRLLPRYVTTRMLQAFAESYASEHSARMLAMGAARKNAGELIDGLVLKRNRLRQATITKELSEIVGGAEALK